MEGEAIRKQILFNNRKIDELYDPSTFTFQPEVSKYIKANEELTRICPHIFQNGKCIYCGKTEN